MYGNLAWGGMAKTNLQPLAVSQKSLLRVICHRPYRYPSDQLFSEFGVLDIRQLYMKTVLLHVNKDRVSYTTEAFALLPGTRNRHLLRPKPVRTTFAQRHFSFLGPRLYNRVMSDISDSLNGGNSNMEQLIVAWLMQRGREASELALTHILR
jgi:hypothetical protein